MHFLESPGHVAIRFSALQKKVQHVLPERTACVTTAYCYLKPGRSTILCYCLHQFSNFKLLFGALCLQLFGHSLQVFSGFEAGLPLLERSVHNLNQPSASEIQIKASNFIEPETRNYFKLIENIQKRAKSLQHRLIIHRITLWH